MDSSWLRFTPYRWAMLAQALLFAPLGFVLRFIFPMSELWRNLFGNIAYETFWIGLFLAIAPRLKPRSVAIAVCLTTCGLEFLQLNHHPILEAARATLPGRLILGNGFTWIDLLEYFPASAIGWFCAVKLKQRFPNWEGAL
jgi:Protein of unknown function (DUF2809)